MVVIVVIIVPHSSIPYLTKGKIKPQGRTLRPSPAAPGPGTASSNTKLGLRVLGFRVCRRVAHKRKYLATV